MITVENNENYSICSTCRGACCKKMPGRYHPSDFGADDNEIVMNILKALAEGKAQIDWWEGDPGDDYDQPGPEEPMSIDPRASFLRPPVDVILPSWRLEDKPQPRLRAWYAAWRGRCALLDGQGCTLSFEDRPLECKMQVPKKSYVCNCADHRHNDKRWYAIEWRPFRGLLEMLIGLDRSEIQTIYEAMLRRNYKTALMVLASNGAEGAVMETKSTDDLLGELMRYETKRS